MNLANLSKYLEIYRTGIVYKLPNDLNFKVQKGTDSAQTYTPEELKQLAAAYKQIEYQCALSCNTIVTLAEENRRLQNENDFMLKLVNSRMKTEDI